ncbi:MAG: hypothetical protein AAF601_08555 [Pseudomonadota bacterium]
MNCDTARHSPLLADEDAPSVAAWLLPLIGLQAVVLCSVLLVMTVGARAPNTPVLALFPPTWDARRSFAAAAQAGADVVRFGPADWLLVVNAPDPDFADRLQANGAVLLLNAAVAQICGRRTG